MTLVSDPLVQTVLGCAIEIHRAIGPGLLESAYESCLARELTLQGATFARQQDVPLRYKGVHLDCGYRVDFIVEGRLIVELKTVDRLLPIHHAQVLTYLKLLGIRQGLLINFNGTKLMDGVKSLVL